ncbi:NAD-dependent protein deacetylase Sirt6 [Aplysia californica]|uniref:NAD-dependent protein deacetylase Sirt6 n=1 Tax=Aplysia californica TaxID=6500 RepID=A0ABM0K3N2_APLCA|nr:NAD-dependent protein deacetylase Sirt6 [Aplysia californica]XP_005108007.1 NAD-dependent protein deacetylase Sirt6 [Aplysia californica]
MESGAASSTSAGTCCLKCCIQNPPSRMIATNGSRVEVRAFEAKGKKNLVVEWKAGGEAIFHRDCWNALVHASQRAPGTATDIELTDLERSMIKESKKTAEYHDSHAGVAEQAARVARILKDSSYCISFTGAGISTAAGIGDFRGKDGKWTEREKKKNYGSQATKAKGRGFVIEELRPTYTHEALVKLTEMGILKYLISQNTDGLHRLSGIPAENMSELHGNSFIEKCESCDARYERTFACRQNKVPAPPLPCPKCKINHRTGRKCERKGCDSYLMNTIINFGDYLESDVLRSAEHHAKRADAVLVLGSTLRVSPANSLVAMGVEPHRIIICNRQTTPYDDDCGNGARVFGDCDRLMREVMRCLLPLPELTTWEKEREQRLVEYSLRRTLVK